jgi:hypothetical protein
MRAVPESSSAPQTLSHDGAKRIRLDGESLGGESCKINMTFTNIFEDI